MKVNVSESDYLTLIWTITVNGKTEVIDKYNEDYVLQNKNKVHNYNIIMYNLWVYTLILAYRGILRK